MIDTLPRRAVLSGGALALVVLGACSTERRAAEAPPSYPVTRPLRKSAQLSREYVGQVRAIQHIELRALERGYLQGVFVDEGQLVKAGQKMFQLMPRITQAEVHKAQAEAQHAHLELDNTRLLADKKIVSPNELALAKVSYDKAAAQLELARVHQGLTELRAPFTGIMGRFHSRKGSLVDEGDLLTTLSDNSTVWVYFNVSEAEYLRLKGQPGQPVAHAVRLQMADGTVFPRPGVVETIEGDFDNETGTIAFRAAFPNPDGLLRHGETGKILLEVPLPDALLIPQKATFSVLDRTYVFVVDERGTVATRPITVQAELPQVFAVASGLSEADQILLDGLRKVRDGSVISPVPRPPSEVLAQLNVPAE